MGRDARRRQLGDWVISVDKLSVALVALFGVGFLGERLAPMNWLGILMIAVGAWFVALKT